MTVKSTKIIQCALCETRVDSYELREETLAFCCHGCSAVYKIIESQNQLAGKKDHPLLAQAVRYGLISNPELIDQIRAQETKSFEQIRKWVFEVEKMWCPACAEFIRLVLGGQTGVIRVSIDYMTDLAAVEYDPIATSKDAVYRLIENLGYKAREFTEEKKIDFSLNLEFSVAAFCALNVMMFAYPLYTTYFSFENEGMREILAWISLILTLPVLGYSARPLYRRMLIQGKQGVLGMEALVGIAISASFILSLYEMVKGTFHVYFDTITVLVAFLLLGKLIESKAKFTSKEALFRLYQAVPKKGRKRMADGVFRFAPLKEIYVGDEIAVFSGERIVIDGQVIDGEGTVDESVITGESVPILKKTGDLVLSGSLLQNGNLRIQVTVVPENSTLNSILRLVEGELSHKSVYVRAADQIVKWFTPLVLAIGCFTFMGVFIFGTAEDAFARAMAVLLIACPCAIGIAAPIIESQVIQRFTEKGALVRNRSLLAQLPKITHFVFDKTGTITEGRFEVLSDLSQLTTKQKFRLKGLVTQSMHPISKAIDAVIKIDEGTHVKVREIPGKGMAGIDDEGSFYLGSRRYMEELGIKVASDDQTTVYYSEKNFLIRILLGDQIKKSSAELLEKLKPFKRFLLSGDQNKAVEQIAIKLGFDAWFGEHTPLEKLIVISNLKSEGASVAMIGDGINDAPSLAKADVGISVVSAADISIQISDLLLTTPSMLILPDLIVLAKRGQKLIRQNLFWAFFYNVVGVVLAICGVLTPLFASFAMIISSLIVLFNSRRI